MTGAMGPHVDSGGFHHPLSRPVGGLRACLHPLLVELAPLREVTSLSIAGLADLVLREPVLAGAMDDAKSGLSTLDLTGPAALRPFVVKGLADAGRTVLVVAATVREAEDLTEELADLISPEAVALYPAWETLPHERLSPRSDTVGRRLAVLRRLRHPGVSSSADGSAGSTRGPESGPVQVVVAP